MLSTLISTAVGTFCIDLLLKIVNLENNFKLIAAIVLMYNSGLCTFAAKKDFIQISDLKIKYIDSERYELEEELKNENSQENVKRL